MNHGSLWCIAHIIQSDSEVIRSLLLITPWLSAIHLIAIVYDICSNCNMGTSDLPEIYAQARGCSPSASTYISGKSQVPMLQLIYSTWVTHLQVWETAGMLCECILYGTM